MSTHNGEKTPTTTPLSRGIVMIDGVTYYKARQAREKLHLTKHEFYRQKAQPWFPKRLVGSQHVYPVRDIDALAEARAEAEPQHGYRWERGGLTFSQSSPGDLRDVRNLALEAAGTAHTTISLSERIEIGRLDPNTFWSLKARGRVVGYFCLMHLPPLLLTALLQGDRSFSSLSAADVLPFPTDESFDLYVGELACDGDLLPQEYASTQEVLLSGFAGVLLDLLSQGYRLGSLYTVSPSHQALALAEKIGFRVLETYPRRHDHTVCIFPVDEEGQGRLQTLLPA
jgi:hypothetical protein